MTLGREPLDPSADSMGLDEHDDPDAQLLLGVGELYSDGVFNKRGPLSRPRRAG